MTAADGAPLGAETGEPSAEDVAFHGAMSDRRALEVVLEEAFAVVESATRMLEGSGT